MKRTMVFFLLVSLAVAAAPLFANGQKQTGSAGQANGGKKITLRFATVASPQQLQVKALKIFKKDLEKSTNGQIQVQIFPSGQLYQQTAQEQAVERGNVAMTFLGGTVQKQVPAFGMFQSAYLFKNYKVMRKVLKSAKMHQFYKDVANKINALPLDGWYLGARDLNYRNIGHEIKTPADLKGVKLRMPDTPAFLNLGRALGANPTPLSFTAVYTALQTGTIDAQDNPLPTDKAQKFYEVAKNISLTHHTLEPVFPGINLKKWNSLTPSEQSKVRSAIDKAGQYMDQQTRQQEQSLVTYFKNHGVTIVHPNIQAFYDHAKKWYENHPSATKGWNMDNLWSYIKKANQQAGS